DLPDPGAASGRRRPREEEEDDDADMQAGSPRRPRPADPPSARPRAPELQGSAVRPTLPTPAPQHALHSDAAAAAPPLPPPPAPPRPSLPFAPPARGALPDASDGE
ncbi:unnamed protein product, partial [Polarella glacialis]